MATTQTWGSVLLCVAFLQVTMLAAVGAQCPAGQEPAPPCGPTASWADLYDNSAPYTPEERDGQGFAASDDGKLYVFGGREKNAPNDYYFQGAVVRYLDIYDIDQGTWTKVSFSSSAAQPPPRYRMGMAYVKFGSNDAKLVVFGGVTATGTLLNDCWEYTISSNTWQPRTAPGPSPRMWPAMFGLGTSAYLFGGQNIPPFSTPPSDHTVDTQGSSFYEFKSGNWVDPYSGSPAGAASEPAPRSAAAMTALGGALYLFGGWKAGGASPNTANEFGDLQKYDPVSKIWTLLPNTLFGTVGPGLRHNSGLTGYEDKLFLSGGNTGINGQQFETFYYDLGSQQWYFGLDPNVPYPVNWVSWIYNPSLATYGDAIYNCGSFQSGGSASGHMELNWLPMECTGCQDIIEQTTAPLPEDETTTTTPEPETTPEVPVETTPMPEDPANTTLSVVEALNTAHLCCVESIRVRNRLEVLLVNALTAYEAGEKALAVRLLRWFLVTAKNEECPLSPCLNHTMAVILDIARAMTVETKQTAAEAQRGLQITVGDELPSGVLERQIRDGDELAAAGLAEAALLAYSASEGSSGLARPPENGVCKQGPRKSARFGRTEPGQASYGIDDVMIFCL